MGLKDLESIHDLVPGTGPVSNMEGAQGPSFDLGSNSTLQVDSLQIVPQFSLYQDLNGQQGPSFDNGPEASGPNEIDTLHEQSLMSNYSYQYGSSFVNISPTNLSLVGGQGPPFDNGPEPNTGIANIDTLHENSLENIYTSVVNPQANYGAGQPNSAYPNVNPSTLDLGGVPGTQFNNGPEPNITPNENDTLHEDSLVNMYNSAVNPEAAYNAGQPGGAWPVVNPSALDLGGIPGPQFDNGLEPNVSPNQIDTFHEAGLVGTGNYSYTYGNSTANVPLTTLDLDGQSGPQFDNGPEPNVAPNAVDSFHESALIQMYNSVVNPEASYGAGQPGNTPWPLIANTVLAGPEPMGNTPGVATFDYGYNSTLHEDLLAQAYTSPINTGASYGQGQPGASWPNVNAGGLDIDGGTPGGYINNLPD